MYYFRINACVINLYYHSYQLYLKSNQYTCIHNHLKTSTVRQSDNIVYTCQPFTEITIKQFFHSDIL